MDPATIRLMRHSVIGVIGLITASSTSADFTPLSPPPGSEASHSTILQAYYSPGFAWAAFGPRVDGDGDAVDLSNGGLVASRVDDFAIGGYLDAGDFSLGGADDQSWTGNVHVTATAVARYAGYSQTFGYDLAGDQTGFVELFSVLGDGADVSGSATLELGQGHSLAWMRGGTGSLYSSHTASNSDGLDHMVTYHVTGVADDAERWVLFFEDLPNGGDHDYNDLVVELVVYQAPEPSTGLLTLAMLAAIKRRRS